MHISDLESGAVLKISGSVDIAAAQELHTALATYAERESQLTLDLSEVDRCDVTALQLLCSLRKTARKAGKPLRFDKVSAAIEELCAAWAFSLDGDFANGQ